MKKSIGIGLGLVLTVASFALAHEGGMHLMGRVKSVDPTTLTVTAKDGKDVRIHLDDKTEFRKSDARAEANDLKVGEKVVVHAMKHGDILHGTLVRFGTSPKAAPLPTDAGTPIHDHGRHAH